MVFVVMELPLKQFNPSYDEPLKIYAVLTHHFGFKALHYFNRQESLPLVAVHSHDIVALKEEEEVAYHDHPLEDSFNSQY